MCFSPEASFAVGAALVPAGAYCLRAAWARGRRLLPVAVVPLGFAAQQAAEGFVWLGLAAGDPARTRPAAFAFLFFALAFWPVWVPLAAAVAERRPASRRLLAAWTVLASAWFWVLYYPLLADPSLLTVDVSHHSVRYAYPDLPVRRYVPRPVLQLLYFLTVAVPMLVESGRGGRVPGGLLAATVAAAAVLYDHAFVSVWCFFAAALSAYLCVVFARLPGPVSPPAAPA